ncbi:glycosyltransferase [Photobacterium leiognathi]|uniref:glycosyltransferase n=1 Tax=Photobacterium leiognathi TaxID=553611 RepID=UPI0029821FEE|nr:glycosyltransferase [Photobacterium leiognathi]
MNIFYFSYFSPPLLNVGANRSRRFSEYLAHSGHNVVVFREGRSHRFAHINQATKTETDTMVDSIAVASWDIDWCWKWPTIIHKQCYRLRHWRSPERDGDIAKRYWLMDLHWGWIVPTLKAAMKKSRTMKPDVIVVSCPPFSSALIGMYLSQWLKVPLVLDFRDAWSHASYFVDNKAFNNEKRILEQADALVVTSTADHDAYQRLYPDKLIRYVPNSYDYILDHVSDNHDVLTIGYSGTWDGFRRSAKGIFSQLAQCDFPIRFINIGDIQPEMMSLIHEHQLDDVVKMIASQPKAQLDEILAQCDVLFIQKGMPDEGKTDTHLATKAIDYVASGKPILAELPEGETLSFLRKYATQLFEVSVNQPQQYYQQLHELYRLWKENQLQVISPSSEFYSCYSCEKLAHDFTQVLEDVTAYKFAERIKT